ncbi:MAG: hypothetical protein K6C32_04310 [Bacilli bacterium]|nr:hypothetical protein [Bacilli bacterium]
MKIEQLLEKYKGLNQAQLIAEGKEAYALFGSRMDRQGYKKEEVVQFATMLARLAAGADRFGTKEELGLFEQITGIDTDKYEFALMTKNANEEEFVRVIDEIVDSLDPATKDGALQFVAVFFAADNHLSEKELALLKRLEA